MLNLDLLAFYYISIFVMLLIWRDSKKPRDETKITPEKEKKILSQFLEYGGSVGILRWSARALSAVFFIWFISGCFSVDLVIPFSLHSIFVFSILSSLLPQISILIALCQIQTGRNLAERDYETARHNEVVRYNKMTIIEAIPFWLLHGVIALIADYYRF